MADAEVTLEQAIDRLRAVPLDEFVAERTRLAKALRAAGERPAAAELAGLTKPTPPAWALNHVARAVPEMVEAWLGTAAALRDASLHARKVGGDAVRAAMAEHRAATSALVGAVQDRAQPGGRALSAPMLERVRDLLQAATADEALAAALAAGRVVEDDGDAARPAASGKAATDAGPAARRTVTGDEGDAPRARPAARRRTAGDGADASSPTAAKARAKAPKVDDPGDAQATDATPPTARQRRAAERAAEKAAARAARRAELEHRAADGIQRLGALREEAETAADAAAAADERRQGADARLAAADEVRAAAAAALADADDAVADARRDTERGASEADAAHEAARAADEAVGIAERELRQLRALLRKA